MMEAGIINVNKPEGWTSHDVCARLRRKLGTRRVGHTGTLDPMAVGVLPVAFGKATRIIEYYDADVKVYRAELKLGATTDTLDSTGEITSESDRSYVTEDMLRAELSRFRGEITQLPPRYSALKVNGKRLYEYAREGKDVEIKPRKAHIISIDDISFDREPGKARFTVACSKGTYIRTLCDDIGRGLGCGSHMTELVRVSSGFFSLADSLSLEEIVDMDQEKLERHVYSMDITLDNLGSAHLNVDSGRFMNGVTMASDEVTVDRLPHIPEWCADADRLNDVYRMYSAEGEFLGTSKMNVRTGAHKPDKVIADR